MAFAYCTADWLSEVDDIALSSTIAADDNQGRYLRAMDVLMKLRPAELRGPAIPLAVVDEDEVVRILSAGAFESAALRLLPGDARLMTSTPGPGRFLATVRLNGQLCESTSSGSTFALAVVSALALAIVDHYHEQAGILPT